MTFAATPSPRTELRALLTLAGPVVVSQFAANALALIATAVIGRLGTAELAAAAYANAAYYLGFIMLVGVMLSVAPRVARAHGAGDSAGIARALRGGLWLAVALTLVWLPVMWLVAAWLPAVAPPDIRSDLAATYLKIYALGMLPNLAILALRGTLEGTGKPRVVTAISLLGVGFAAVVSPALAYGWGPLPRLGLPGAAATSVLATWGMALALWPLAWRQAVSDVSVQDVRQEVRALFRLGWPIGLTLGAEGGMFTVTTLLMARFGPEVLAAHNVTLQAITAIFMIPLGISSATGVRVGQAAGAGEWQRARWAGLLGLAVSGGVMVGFAVLELVAPRLVFGVFLDTGNPANASVIAAATIFLGIAALFQTVDGIQVTANGALRGLQDTRAPLLVSLLAYWLLGLGLGAWLAFGLDMGGRGLWFGLTAGLTFAAVALVWRFLMMTKKAH
ncbi:MATE family efflux transporter [Deinococcus deserti]|uniref:Multidrug-efflux transporter n=1 Tax=Deinococcus deserti (strain DSM 17065 / CIP 109153 / LMG 22923 / VCD115) TaxID=546414 RepID=C1CYC8_DEIDV|nr:MATE family efflux transporter [Deinococcus deserti]ACO44949.1 putative multidrug resistance protein norM, Multidrug-efflux transporter [Deinococcus deserti VCD115]